MMADLYFKDILVPENLAPISMGSYVRLRNLARHMIMMVNHAGSCHSAFASTLACLSGGSVLKAPSRQEF